MTPTHSNSPTLPPPAPAPLFGDHGGASAKDLAELVARACGVPTAVLTVAAPGRHSIVAATGWCGDVAPVVRACEQAVRQQGVLVLHDAEPGIRFFAAVPLIGTTGEASGVLAVIDHGPRTAEPGTLELLRAFAKHAASHVRLCRDDDRLTGAVAERDRALATRPSTTR
jgi:GAF domain-containing protein